MKHSESRGKKKKKTTEGRTSVLKARLAVLAVMAGSTVVARTGHAEIITWTGTDGLSYDQGANWSGGVVPGATATATYPVAPAGSIGIAGSRSVQGFDLQSATNFSVDTATSSLTFLGSGLTGSGVSGSTITNAGSLTFANSSTAGAASIVNNGGTVAFGDSATISGGALSGTGGSINFTGAARAATVSSLTGTPAVQLGNGINLNVTNTDWDSGLFAGTISGGGSLTVTTNSLMRLTGAATHTGGTTVATNANLLVGDWGTSGSLSGNVANSGYVIFTRSDATTYQGQITGSGQILQSGEGTLILTGANTARTVYVDGGGTLQIGAGNTAGALTANRFFLDNSSKLAFNRSDTVNLNAAVSGQGSLVQRGTGTLVVRADVTTTGDTIIESGSLQIGSGSSFGSVSGGRIVNNGTVIVNRSGFLTMDNDITGIGNLVQQRGSLSLTGRVDYKGTTTVSAATLLLSNADLVGNVNLNSFSPLYAVGGVRLAGNVGGTGQLLIDSEATLTLLGATTNEGGVVIFSGQLQIGDGGTTGSVAGTVTGAGGDASSSVHFNRSDTLVHRGLIEGALDLVQEGAGRTILTANDTYSGRTIVRSGVLQIGDGGTTGRLGTGTVTVGQGAALAINRAGTYTFGSIVAGEGGTQVMGTGTTVFTADHTYTGLTAIDAGATLQLGAGASIGAITGSVAGDIRNDGALVFDRSDLTYNGAISGGGTVIHQGGSVLTLGGTNTYSGGTVVSGGTIAVARDANLGTGDLWMNGGTMRFLGSFDSTRAISLAPFEGTTDVTFDTNGFTSTQRGVVSGDAGLVKTGAGRLTLAADNSWTGPTTIDAGVLQIGAGGTTGTLGSGDVVNNAVLEFNRGGLVTVANAISGTGQLVKSGGGEVALTGTNTYQGTTNIDGGLLTIRSDANLGAASSAVVFNGGLLKIAANYTTGRTMSLGAGGGGFDTNGFSATVNTAITGVGALTKTGAGTLTLTGTSTYRGGTLFNGGTVEISRNANLGDAAGGMTFNGGALRLLAGVDMAREITLNAAGGTIDTQGFTSVQTGAIGGSGGLTKTGSGTLVLAGAGGVAGTTTIADGTLQLGNGGTTGAVFGNVVNSGTLRVVRSDILTLGGVISGSGQLVQAGTGTTVLTGSNTYRGTTTISSGTLQVGDGGTTGTLGTGAVANSGTLAFNRSNTLTVDNAISGGGALVQQGRGVTILTGTNDYSGTTTISAGTLQIGDGGIAGTLGTGAVTNDGILAFNRSDVVTVRPAIAGRGHLVQQGAGTTILVANNTYGGTTTISSGTLQVGDGGTTGTLGDGVGTIANNGTLAFNRSDSVTVANAISGKGALAQQGRGTTILTGANDYKGTTTISSGTLQVGNGGVAGTLGSGAVTDDGALSINRSDRIILANAISGSGALMQRGRGTTVLTGGNDYSGTTTISSGLLQVGDGGAAGTLGTGAVSNSTTLVVYRSGSVTLAGAISGTGALVQQGTSTTILTGANDYSGLTTISSGTLQVGNGGGSGTLGAGDVANSATLAINRSGIVTVAGAISGTGTLVQQGNGTAILTGNNDYTGATTIVAGTLQIGDGGTRGTLGTAAVTDNGTLAFNRSDVVTIGNAISGSGALVQKGTGTAVLVVDTTYSGGTTISAGTLQLGNGGTSGWIVGNVLNDGTLAINRSDAVTFGGAVSGNGGLRQVGGGSTNLVAANTYTGPTTVEQGRLAVNGSITSDTTVFTGGTLGGNGTIAGTVTNRGTVAPGNSIGLLTVAGSYTQAAGSTYQVELNAQGQNDRINVSGAPGTAIINGGTVAVQAAPGKYPKSYRYTIVNGTGGVSGTYNGLTSDLTFMVPTLSYDANNVYLTVAIPSDAFSRMAQTCNQHAVGQAIDRVALQASGDFDKVTDLLLDLTGSQGAVALEALSGQPYAAFTNAAFANGGLFAGTVRDQAAAARRGIGRTPLANDESLKGWGAWATGMGGTGLVGGAGNTCGGVATQTYSSAGFAAGIDYRLTPQVLVGLSLGILSGQQWTSGFTGRGNSDSYNAALYASYTSGAFYADAVAGYAWNENRMTRPINIAGLSPRIATGTGSATLWQAQAELGYRLPFDAAGPVGVTPFGRFEAAALSQNALTEAGALSLNLDVAAQQATSLRSVLGMEVNGRVGSEQPLDLRLRLGWAHEYAPLERPVAASFAGAPGSWFTVYGAQPTRDSATVAFDAALALDARTAVGLHYDGAFASQAADHVLKASLRFIW